MSTSDIDMTCIWEENYGLNMLSKKAPDQHCASKSRGGTRIASRMASKFGGHQGRRLASSQMWYKIKLYGKKATPTLQAAHTQVDPCFSVKMSCYYFKCIIKFLPENVPV
jgi:hypothetical protein